MSAESWLASVSIIPVRKGEKAPPLLAWEEFKTRIATPEERAEWANRWPGHNVAMVCGKISGYVVLDFDGDAGKALLALHKLDLDVSTGPPRSITPHGAHLFYEYPTDPKQIALLGNYVKIVDGLDVRSDGGYVLLPPSLHPSGKKYIWALPPWKARA